MNTINKTSIFRPEAYKTWFRRSLFSPLFRVHYRSNVVVFILDNQCATTSGGSSRFLETRRTNNNDCPDHGIPDTGQFSVFFRYSEFFFQFFFFASNVSVVCRSKTNKQSATEQYRYYLTIQIYSERRSHFLINEQKPVTSPVVGTTIVCVCGGGGTSYVIPTLPATSRHEILVTFVKVRAVLGYFIIPVATTFFSPFHRRLGNIEF